MGISTLLATLTADGDSSLSDTSSMTSTYDEYMFVFTDIGPATDDQDFSFQVNASSQSGYNETMTTTYFGAGLAEDDGSSDLSYDTSEDLAQGTGEQTLFRRQGSDADQSIAGVMHVFSPSNTTYVTHFYARMHGSTSTDASRETFVAGYINVTAAITDIRFKFASGDFDGVIQIYGIS